MNSLQLLAPPGQPSFIEHRNRHRRKEPACFCAADLEQVEAAWRLVYDRYREMGFVNENHFGIHAIPTVMGPHTCVVGGPDWDHIGYTMTLSHDNALGMALDSVYPSQLDELRRRGRRLMEVGMLADRRQGSASSIGALFVMMRWAIGYALHTQATDIVVGVHPRHVEFYIKRYGFEVFGPMTTYPMVGNNLVVPLRFRLQERFAQDELPRGLADYRDNPLPHEAFAHRFTFDHEQLLGSRSARFLEARYGKSYMMAKPMDTLRRSTRRAWAAARWAHSTSLHRGPMVISGQPPAA